MDLIQHRQLFSRAVNWSAAIALVLAAIGVGYEIMTAPADVFQQQQQWQWAKIWDTYVTYLLPSLLLLLPIAYIVLLLKQKR